MSSPLQTVLARNRTEELGYDVWREFVVPPFFDELDFAEARKPRVIIGGRGCGKTMLLRYLSHYSAFSTHRQSISEDALRSIGLYWRADTQFSALMAGRGVEEDVWRSAFHHLLALIASLQVLESIASIASSKLQAFTSAELDTVDLSPLHAFDENAPIRIQDLQDYLQSKLWNFETWVANVRTRAVPDFLPGVRFTQALIQVAKKHLPGLRESSFAFYVDEYENLLEYQQRAINTRLKHSEFPLIFHIAAKRNAFEVTGTEGAESIVNIADYRIYDLEELLPDEDFVWFAAEVLFLQLAIAQIRDVPIDPSTLRDPTALAARRQTSYRRQVLDAVRTIFPGLTHAEMADAVFKDVSLRAKLRERIVQGLKRHRSELTITSFDRPEVPEAVITATALLYRQRLSPEEISNQLDALQQGQANKFTGPTNWIHNNFIGCLLDLYDGHAEPCPFYAGFGAFTTMARGNLRHFLELCHKSLALESREDYNSMTVMPERQARAARQVSTAFLSEIRSFGRLGNQLHTFTLRLGSLFSLAHKRLAQSEPEQSHFGVVKGQSTLSEHDIQLLREAVKWSVLFEDEATKVKDLHHQIDFEYVLNPIYAPYFHITYRKKRKLELSADDLIVLTRGTYDQVRALLREYSRKWEVSLESANPTLFSHLIDGPG